jgi:hypothetical protein
LVEALRLHGASEDVGDACETMCRVVAVRTSQSRFEEGEQALVEFDAFRDAHPAFRPAEMGCRAAAMGAQLACARVRRLLGLPLHGDLPEGLPEAPHTDWAALGPALASAQSAAAVATEAAEAYGHASGDARQVRDARRLAAEVRRLHLAYGQEDAP